MHAATSVHALQHRSRSTDPISISYCGHSQGPNLYLLSCKEPWDAVQLAHGTARWPLPCKTERSNERFAGAASVELALPYRPKAQKACGLHRNVPRRGRRGRLRCRGQPLPRATISIAALQIRHVANLVALRAAASVQPKSPRRRARPSSRQLAAASKRPARCHLPVARSIVRSVTEVSAAVNHRGSVPRSVTAVSAAVNAAGRGALAG